MSENLTSYQNSLRISLTFRAKPPSEYNSPLRSSRLMVNLSKYKFGILPDRKDIDPWRVPTTEELSERCWCMTSPEPLRFKIWRSGSNSLKIMEIKIWSA